MNSPLPAQSTCEFCLAPKKMGDPICGAYLPKDESLIDSFVCTRPPRHDGKHVACGAKHDLVRWTEFHQDTCDGCRGKQDCPALDSGYACTREIGHDGQHIACGGIDAHELHKWDEFQQHPSLGEKP